MDIKTTKTYACKKAIPISNKKIAEIKAKVKIPTKKLTVNNWVVKNNKICNKECPDIKLANNRIAKLNPLET